MIPFGHAMLQLNVGRWAKALSKDSNNDMSTNIENYSTWLTLFMPQVHSSTYH